MAVDGDVVKFDVEKKKTQLRATAQPGATTKAAAPPLNGREPCPLDGSIALEQRSPAALTLAVQTAGLFPPRSSLASAALASRVRRTAGAQVAKTHPHLTSRPHFVRYPVCSPWPFPDPVAVDNATFVMAAPSAVNSLGFRRVPIIGRPVPGLEVVRGNHLLRQPPDIGEGADMGNREASPRGPLGPAPLFGVGLSEPGKQATKNLRLAGRPLVRVERFQRHAGLIYFERSPARCPAGHRRRPAVKCRCRHGNCRANWV